MPELRSSLVPFLLWTLSPPSKHHFEISLLEHCKTSSCTAHPLEVWAKLVKRSRFLSDIPHDNLQLFFLISNFFYYTHLEVESTESKQGQSQGSPWRSCPPWMCAWMILAQSSCQRTPEAQEEVSGPCGLHSWAGLSKGGFTPLISSKGLWHRLISLIPKLWTTAASKAQRLGKYECKLNSIIRITGTRTNWKHNLISFLDYFTSISI